jgi:hypothetical protein
MAVSVGGETGLEPTTHRTEMLFLLVYRFLIESNGAVHLGAVILLYAVRNIVLNQIEMSKISNFPFGLCRFCKQAFEIGSFRIRNWMI